MVAPLVTMAQPAGLRRIGYLGNGRSTPVRGQQDAFLRGLRALGWIEGQNVTIEYRWAEGNLERLPVLVGELARAKVDVILVSGGPAVRAAKGAGTAIPIVFVLLTDPVTLGFVQTLAHPGGNMTGLASQFEELITKQLELLKEALPKLSRVALLRHTGNPNAVLTAAENAASSIGLTARTLDVTGVADFESAFKAAQVARVGAIVVLPSPYFDAQRARLIELAARYRLPAFYEFRNYVDDGGLISYGPNINEMYARAASYVDRILKGARPADLAIERPTKFELVINLTTAKELGIAIPKDVLLRADEVIQ